MRQMFWSICRHDVGEGVDVGSAWGSIWCRGRIRPRHDEGFLLASSTLVDNGGLLRGWRLFFLLDGSGIRHWWRALYPFPRASWNRALHDFLLPFVLVRLFEIVVVVLLLLAAIDRTSMMNWGYRIYQHRGYSGVPFYVQT